MSALNGFDFSVFSTVFLHQQELVSTKILQLCKNNQYEFFFHFFPHLKTLEHEQIFLKYESFCQKTDATLNHIIKEVGRGNQKEFSTRISHIPFSKYLFFIYKGTQKDTREMLASLDVQTVLSFVSQTNFSNEGGNK